MLHQVRSVFTVASCFVLAALMGAPVSAANGGVTYAYDALGRVTSVSYDTGVIIYYSYDANGNRLSQTVNANSTTAVWGTSNWGAALWN